MIKISEKAVALFSKVGKSFDMIKKRAIVLSVICVLTAVLIYLLNTFYITHNLKFELIDEAKAECELSGLGEKLFFIKDSGFSPFYDGKEFLANCAPNYDKSKLDTEKYTYLITIGRKVKSIKYSGRKCLMRTYFLFPDEYAADIDCEETDDKILRIYRVKKMNIDYDYHA